MLSSQETQTVSTPQGRKFSCSFFLLFFATTMAFGGVRRREYVAVLLLAVSCRRLALSAAGRVRDREPMAEALSEVPSDRERVEPIREPVVVVPVPSDDSSDNRERIELCDCRPAAGEPEGLSCDGEGYVVAGFERHGQWMAGGQPVPLSRAVCCRPCSHADQTDEADVIVSVGCHTSSDSRSAFRCERRPDGGGPDGEFADPNSFVVGFTSASRVFAPGEPAYYPSDAAACCSPSVFHANGEVTSLEPCDCIEEAEVSCGGDGDGRALVGFDDERIAPNGHFVPVGAATCCRLCVGKKTSMDCAALDHCSGRGACILGSCACVSGWTGASCAVREAGGGDVPAWAIAVIVVGSCLLGVVAIGSLAYICELVIEAREARQRDEDAEEGEGDEGMTRPLLIHLDRDDDGSVGSEDTTDEEEDEGEEDSEVAGRIAAAERELNDDEAGEQGEGGDEEQQGDVQQGETRAESGSGRPSAAATGAGGDDVEDIERIKERLKRGEGPLGGVVCAVCLHRPVQVCVIPCGHVCMCRRCSRRVRRCPVCRSVVARRQKLYL